MKKLVELAQLQGLRWKVGCYEMTQTLHDMIAYCGNSRFRRAYLQWWLSKKIASPYRISDHYYREKGEEHPFGETPLSVLEKICTIAKIGPDAHVFDLGCATGITSLWFHCFTGCRVTGIDRVPHFIEKAKRLAETVPGHAVDFQLMDMRAVDYSRASHVYLYGLTFDEPFMWQLVEKLLALPQGAAVVTVGEPLADYSIRFETTSIHTLRYPWGSGEVYVQIRK